MPPVTRSRRESVPEAGKLSEGVIVISSDEEESRNKRKTRASLRRSAAEDPVHSRSTPKKRLSLIDANVSPQTDSTDASEQLKNDRDRISSRLLEVRKELRKAKKENTELIRQNRKLRKETCVEVFRGVQDSILCEICDGFLWDPYLLMPCGHTACRDCIIKWFNTVITRDAHSHRLHCLKCRQPLEQKPTPNYSLKSLVHVVAPIVDSSARPAKKLPNDGGWAAFDRFF